MFLAASRLDTLNSVVTLIAIVVFVTLGVFLRRYATSKKGRYTRESLAKRYWKTTRTYRLRAFHNLANEVIDDVSRLMNERRRPDEARALGCLISDARKKGECLLASRQFYHTYSPRSESALRGKVNELARLEQRLKALPRSSLTLEDVLAGRFQNCHANSQGAEL